MIRRSGGIAWKAIGARKGLGCKSSSFRQDDCVKIRILHAYYGCDTGCCGHILEIDDEEIEGSFEFGHPDDLEELRAYILENVPKECHESIDWPSVEFDSERFNSGWC